MSSKKQRKRPKCGKEPKEIRIEEGNPKEVIITKRKSMSLGRNMLKRPPIIINTLNINPPMERRNMSSKSSQNTGSIKRDQR